GWSHQQIPYRRSSHSGRDSEAPLTYQKPVTGITAIKAKHQKVGLQEAEAIDLGGDDGIDAKLTEEGGVRIEVTGWVTFSGMEPRRFRQTSVLWRQHRCTDRHSYYIREDTFGFLDGQDVDVEAQ
ncbi:unnamed protein product, partial [Ascophyllum nodosum]